MVSFWFFMIAGLIPFYLVISSKVNDGLLIKFGLILLSLGFFGAAGALYDDCDIINPCMTATVGFLIVILGMLWRFFGAKDKRKTDWLHIQRDYKAKERRQS